MIAAVPAEVWASAITAASALLVGLGTLIVQLRRLDRNNREDHALVQAGQDRIEEKVDRVNRRLDTHIQHHEWKAPRRTMRAVK